MKRFFLFFFASLCAVIPVCSQVNVLERCTPESQGVPSEKITALFDSLMTFPNTDIHSVMVLRHGKVIAEMYPAPFKPEYGHQLFSCSKTFTAAAVGIAIMENRLRLDDRLATFFPELLPDSISEWLAEITVRDLLTMTSGFEVDTKMRTFSSHWIEGYLKHPMVARPGERFAYDSIDTYLLSAIVQRVTGMKMMDYLKQRLFLPLGITEAYWEESPEGINSGGWGLYLQPESLAKFGQLLLNKGEWNGMRLLPAKWVDEMTSRKVNLPNGDDYGYQMWMCAYPNASRADGAYGQYIIVIPDKEMVITINIVVYESTVYPGLTEEVCAPLLASTSGLKLNQSFFVGFSPERINPGDTVHTIENIVKVTSGSTPEAAAIIDSLYASVLTHGTYKAKSIKIAEACKLMENCQRDVQIAFFNEMEKIFDKMNINIEDVTAAASTKWNFVPATPGLVGGHCIAVDPYYLINKAQEVDVVPSLLSTAREVNEQMAVWMAGKIKNASESRKFKAPETISVLCFFSSAFVTSLLLWCSVLFITFEAILFVSFLLL